eukprot:TRINITY_DN64774_c0_g1_i1.p1 TRINITY_DN64774_c0_g1~~TRINITY_DN64774_c0_g1_i1.p1  ORF type:complete len:313 (+),score=30.25 TRINITY_DN64774_c0_g1_i1:244-1182(+)
MSKSEASACDGKTSELHPTIGPRCASLIAGLTAGLARTWVGHPFDTLKVLQQTGGRTTISHVWSMSPIALIARLYRGCGPPLVTVSIYTSAAFGIYESVRLPMEVTLLRSANLNVQSRCLNLSADSLRLICVFAAGTISGGILAVPTCPLANLQVLQQTSQGSGRRNSVLGWMRQLHAERGFKGFYRGFFPHLVQGGIGRGCYMTGYEIAKLVEEMHFAPGFSQTLIGKTLAASIAGITGWILTYPVDVARSNLIYDWRRERYTSTFQTLQSLFREGRCYSGLSYTLARAVPVAAITLPTYEFTLQAILNSR